MNRLPLMAETFAVSSLLSFGGTNAVVPHLRREVVDRNAWVSDAGFAEAYAVSQVTPGPSTTMVTLLGYQAAGVPGALLATIAMVLPSCTLAYAFARLWLRTGSARWHEVVERGLGPVGVGLIGSAGVVVARAVDHGWLAWSTTVLACALLTLTEINPLLVIALGAAMGMTAS